MSGRSDGGKAGAAVVGDGDADAEARQQRKLLRACALELRRASHLRMVDFQVVQRTAKESQRESAGRESWRFGAFMRPGTGWQVMLKELDVGLLALNAVGTVVPMK